MLECWNNGFYYFKRKPVVLLNKHDRLRKAAKIAHLSKEARTRLEWMIFYESKASGNISLVCRHFGIARKTFYKWHKLYDEKNLASLESRSTAPLRRRQKEYTSCQYERVVRLRKKHIRYGKVKLLEKYRKEYPRDDNISTWKIQCIIQTSGIYYHPRKQARTNRKRQLSQKRKKITELKQKKVNGFLLCLDTIVKYYQSKKRYIITAIDKYSKVAFARMYTTHSSYNTADFLYRLHYLLDGRITNIQTDNGSEFKKYFYKACQDLNLAHYHSRTKTPKDNATNERFNRTLQEEFVELGNMTDNTTIFNRKLTEWLIEYNFRRPHQALDYMPPINFNHKYHKVLPRYPSSTIY